MEKIDFVITWVDGNDEEWQKEKSKYKSDKDNLSDSKNRYRDWELLRYWFRSVENYAPWVNNIFFITYGHLPKWINVNNSKLRIIKHSDYIPNEYLPTFSSHTIENNLYLIDELSEHFVYFNDDMFLNRPTKPEDFFKNGKPCDLAACNINMPWGREDVMSHIMLNNIDIINKYFKKNEVIRKNILKWFSLKNGSFNFRTLLLLPFPKLSNLVEMHLPSSLCKSKIKEVTQKEANRFKKTSMHKFRDALDINQWVFRYWNIMNGNFYPRSYKFGKCIEINNDIKELENVILNSKYKVICLNDSSMDIDFEYLKTKINNFYGKKLPNKSSFEI